MEHTDAAIANTIRSEQTEAGHGHLVLAGVVRDQAELEAIPHQARSVDGVRGVKSYLQFRSQQAAF